MYTVLSTKGIAKLSLLILLLASAVVGAVLSYLWTVGYYVEIGFRVPEGVTTVTIMNVSFPIENSTYFDVTVLNPSYSKADANIASISMISSDNDIETPGVIEPSIPYPLRKGEEITFRCALNWGEYAGQNVTVAVLVKDGSGATTSYQTVFVRFDVTSFAYNTAITVSRFNVTVRNWSNISLDISEIRLENDIIPPENISVNNQPITFPYQLLGNESVEFVCRWTLWDAEANSGYLGTENSLFIETLQGYRAVHSRFFSKPVFLTLSNITYPQLNETQFILRNELQSPHNVNLTRITISVGNETFTVAHNASGYVLEEGSEVTILCEDKDLNWENWPDQKITIRVYTTQGFMAKKEETIPSQ